MATRYMSGHTNTNYTYSVRKSGAYTMTTTDQHVVVTSSATITLPAISTFLAAGVGTKTYAFEVSGSGVTITIAQNSADTINGSTSNITITGDGTILELVSDSVKKNWEVASDMPYLSSANLQDNAVTTAKITAANVTGAKLSTGTHFCAVTKATSGTTAQNVFSASGAPAAITITGVFATAKDTNAGNMILKNGTNTVASFAKSTTAGVMTGEDGALSNTTVTSGDTVTVESSTTNGDGYVLITFTSA